MEIGFVKFDWKEADNFTDEEISYFLYLEGKSTKVISRIRNMDIATIEGHIIEGKIKYRFLAKSSNINELFDTIARVGKEDKIAVIKSLNDSFKKKLLSYIRSNYINFDPKNKEVSVWIIGELNDIEALDILIKASVHKSVGIRRMAVSALGKLNNKRCEDILIRSLSDANPQVVLYAIKALQRIGSEKASEQVRAVTKAHNKDYIVRAVEDYNNSISNSE